jgi:hypothetical protein
MTRTFCGIGISLGLLAASGFGQTPAPASAPPPRCLPTGPMPTAPGAPLPPTNCPSPVRTATGPVPDTTAFRFLFLQVMAVEARADSLKAQGKDDTIARESIRRTIHLTNQGAALLKQVAQQCNSDYAAVSKGQTSQVQQLRAQYPDPSNAPAEVFQSLSGLKAQRESVIAGCMQTLRTGMGNGLYQILYNYVMSTVAPGITHVDPLAGVAN